MSMSAEPSSLDVLAIAAFTDTESEYDLSKFPEAEFVESHEIQARADPKVRLNLRVPDKAPAKGGSSFNQLLGIKGPSKKTVCRCSLYEF
ncbi:hypothetical protein ACFX14_036137 [Malus domestica]